VFAPEEGFVAPPLPAADPEDPDEQAENRKNVMTTAKHFR
jgi:hypothetical protein